MDDTELYRERILRHAGPVITGRAPRRSKRVRYDPALLPRLDPAKEYAASDVVTDPEIRKQIADAADEPDYVANGFDPWISSAPVHIVVCVREDDYHERYREADKLQDELLALVDRAEYKRRQAPPGIRITSKAFGRDRRLPITNRFGG